MAGRPSSFLTVQLRTPYPQPRDRPAEPSVSVRRNFCPTLSKPLHTDMQFIAPARKHCTNIHATNGGLGHQSASRFGLTDGSDDSMFKLFFGQEF